MVLNSSVSVTAAVVFCFCNRRRLLIGAPSRESLVSSSSPKAAALDRSAARSSSSSRLNLTAVSERLAAPKAQSAAKKVSGCAGAALPLAPHSHPLHFHVFRVPIASQPGVSCAMRKCDEEQARKARKHLQTSPPHFPKQRAGGCAVTNRDRRWDQADAGRSILHRRASA